MVVWILLQGVNLISGLVDFKIHCIIWIMLFWQSITVSPHSKLKYVEYSSTKFKIMYRCYVTQLWFIICCDISTFIRSSMLCLYCNWVWNMSYHVLKWILKICFILHFLNTNFTLRKCSEIANGNLILESVDRRLVVN